MKSSVFKMRGYTYPGISPVKGRAQMKRDAAAERRKEAADNREDAFENKFSDNTEDNRLTQMTGQPAPTTQKEKYAPMRKASPARVIPWTLIGTEAAKAAVSTGITVGAQALIEGNTKKDRATVNRGGMSMKFGGSEIA